MFSRLNAVLWEHPESNVETEIKSFPQFSSTLRHREMNYSAH